MSQTTRQEMLAITKRGAQKKTKKKAERSKAFKRDIMNRGARAPGSFENGKN